MFLDGTLILSILSIQQSRKEESWAQGYFFEAISKQWTFEIYGQFVCIYLKDVAHWITRLILTICRCISANHLFLWKNLWFLYKSQWLTHFWLQSSHEIWDLIKLWNQNEWIFILWLIFLVLKGFLQSLETN